MKDVGEITRQYAATVGITITEQQLEQLNHYAELLLQWNEKMNLTAITEAQDVAVKHFVDSLIVLNYVDVPDAARVIDVGTGAGFPGIPLKIMRPDIELVLLDSLKKRTLFLQHIVQTLHLSNTAVLHGRAEDAARNPRLRDRFDIAVSRAVARLNVLCEYCIPFVQPGGTFIAWKGPDAEHEIEECQRVFALLGCELSERYSLRLPFDESSRVLIAIHKLIATPREYPRRAGTAHKHPLQ